MSPLRTFTEVAAKPGRATAAMVALGSGARLPEFVDTPDGGQIRLHQADTIFFGAGSVGLSVLDPVSRSRPRRVRIVDYGVAKNESVLTHPIGPDEVGKSKARIAGERVKAISPSTQVLVFEGALQDLPLGALVGADCIVLASDNLAAEMAACRRAVQLSMPLLQASVHGGTLTVDLRSFENRRSDDPHLCCLYTLADWSDLDRGTRFSCDGSDTSRAPDPSRVPTLSPAMLCGLAGQFAATAWLRRTLLGSSGDAWALQYNGYTMKTVRSDVARRANCLGDHTSFEVREIESAFDAATPREILESGGWDGRDLRGISIEVEGFEFAALALCECSPHAAVDRFFAKDTQLGSCGQGHARSPHPMYRWIDVPGRALESSLDVSLAQLGAGAAASAIVHRCDGAVLVHAAIESASSAGESAASSAGESAASSAGDVAAKSRAS